MYNNKERLIFGKDVAGLAQQLTRYQILEALREGQGQTVSGGELAEALNISRTAVWKSIATLQNEGYRIEPVPNRGYRFQESEVFSAYEIQRRLDTRIVGHPVVFLEEVDSTNDFAKSLAAQGGVNGTAVVARRQTKGKGRLGRRFESPAEKGVYFTLLLRPDIRLDVLNRITLLAAVAIADAVEELAGVRPGIKWTNDLYLGGRKLCGILTECSVEGETGRVAYVAVGIGMNLHQTLADFPPELRSKAGSLEMVTGKHVAAADYAAAAFRCFERLFFDGNFPKSQEEVLRRYREGIFFLGKEIEVREFSGASYRATALDIDGEGRLVIRDREGRIQALNSGEISIRF